MVLWALAAIVFLLLGIYVPSLSSVLRLTAVELPNLLLTVIVVVLILSILELKKIVAPPEAPALMDSHTHATD